MSLIKQAYEDIFPQKSFRYSAEIIYTGRMKGYNAHIVQLGRKLTVKMAKSWQEVAEDIQIGLIQELLMKLFKEKKKTKYTQMYNTFLKHAPAQLQKKEQDPVLLERFTIINEKYFNGTMEVPSLKIGQKALTKLGHYSFNTDTIVISSILLLDQELLDFVLYHEMLHKLVKYKENTHRTTYHSKEFRKLEAMYENFEEIEKKLEAFIRKERKKKHFWKLD